MKRLLAAALLVLAALPGARRQRLHPRQLRRPEAGGGRWIGASRTAFARAVPIVVGPSRSWFAPSRSGVAPRGGGGGAPSADFDFYVLALSWSPSFCATRRRRARPRNARRAPIPASSRMACGRRYQNGYPSQCPGDPYLPYSVLSRPRRSLSRSRPRPSRMAPARPVLRQESVGLFRRCPRGARRGRRAAALKAPQEDRRSRRSTSSAPSSTPIRACGPA